VAEVDRSRVTGPIPSVHTAQDDRDSVAVSNRREQEDGPRGRKGYELDQYRDAPIPSNHELLSPAMGRGRFRKRAMEKRQDAARQPKPTVRQASA
jgi:hypothetical protein